MEPFKQLDGEQIQSYLPFSLNGWHASGVAAVTVFVIVLGRYIFLCLSIDFILWRWPWRARAVLPRLASMRERRGEIFLSLRTSAIFSISGVAIGWMWQNGYAQFYLPLARHGFWYLPLSWFIYAFVHDTIYYWAHRLMHVPFVYRHAHAAHHASLRPSVWASFAFANGESLFQAALLPLLLLFIPIHPLVFLLHLTFMTLTAISNHSGYELLPGGRVGRWLSGWMISGAHHALHHRFGRSNYGLFFTFWDRWGGTENSRFEGDRARLFEVK